MKETKNPRRSLLRRILIWSGAAFGLLLLVAAGMVAYSVNGLLHVFGTSAAAQVCAGRFISGRSLEAVWQQSFRTEGTRGWLYRQLDIEISEADGTVVVTSWGARRAIAQRVEGRGCVVLPPGSELPAGLPPGQVAALRSDTGPALRWATRAALTVDIDAAALDAAVEELFARPEELAHSLLIYRDGELLREVYRGAVGPGIPSDSWSLGKTLVGTLTGVLIAQGRLSLDEAVTLAQWPEPNDPRRAITVRNLLNMSSGLDFSTKFQLWPVFIQSDHSLVYTNLPDVAAFAADRPLAHAPGSFGTYSNADTLLLLEFIRQKLNLDQAGVIALLRQEVLTPLGMDDLVLSTDFVGLPIITGYDYASARSWAQLGLLYAQDGVWNGRRLLPEGWVDFARTPAPGYPSEAYGAQVWLNRHGWYTAPREVLVMSGAGDQIVLVDPEQRLVVVRMGHANRAHSAEATLNEVLAGIYAAIGAPLSPTP